MLDGTSKLGLIDCPGALVAGLSLSSPLEHLLIHNFAGGPWLPAAAQRLSALRVLQVHMWSGQDKEQPAWHASLNSALAHMPQLEALWMAGNWDQGFQTAIAGLARLERLFWRDALGRQPTVPLPHGPYQLSMRRLVLQSDLAQLSTATLAGMPQLERLSLFEMLRNRESSLWNAFWCWAERHQELRCLELMDEAWVEDGVLPTPTVNAMLQLASCRPSLLVRALPSDDEEDGFKAYREAILGQWK